MIAEAKNNKVILQMGKSDIHLFKKKVIIGCFSSGIMKETKT